MADKPENKGKGSGLGLDRLGLTSMSAFLKARPASPAGEAGMIDLDRIEIDPQNVRKRYSPTGLKELEESIDGRGGVISPVVLRPDPDREGHYIVSQGNRRVQAAKKRGMKQILAVVNDDFQRIDQVIENIQREGLHMLDLADFIAEGLAGGMKQKDLARVMGKSEAFVSQYQQLRRLSEVLRGAVERGVFSDVSTVLLLAGLEKRHPEAVAEFVAGSEAISRNDVKRLKERLEGEGGGEGTAPVGPDGGERSVVKSPLRSRFEVGEAESLRGAERPETGGDGTEPLRLHRPVIRVRKGEHRGVLVLNMKGKTDQHVWIRYDNDLRGKAGLAEVPLKSLEFLALEEGRK